jgi:hypothetical protein
LSEALAAPEANTATAITTANFFMILPSLELLLTLCRCLPQASVPSASLRILRVGSSDR